tara:strand:+ start:1278 stop:1736 length:459 start_codon:yes stop_codon:yes gene_type:complete
MRTFSKLFSTLLNLGFLPYAPGTIASAVTVVFWYMFIQFFSIYFFAIFVLIITILSIYLVNIYLEDLLSEDPREVVVDEFIGQSIPLMFLTHNTEIFEILFAFICFRIFDIYKIYPVNLGEKMKGSIGVISDDIIAGIYTVIFLMIYKIIFY